MFALSGALFVFGLLVPPCVLVRSVQRNLGDFTPAERPRADEVCGCLPAVIQPLLSRSCVIKPVLKLRPQIHDSFSLF